MLKFSSSSHNPMPKYTSNILHSPSRPPFCESPKHNKYKNPGNLIIYAPALTLLWLEKTAPIRRWPEYSPRKGPGFAKYAVDANLFRLESSILMRAKRATNRNNVGGEHSLGEYTGAECSRDAYTYNRQYNAVWYRSLQFCIKIHKQ